MKVLITGCNGMLGSTLCTEFNSVYEVWGLDTVTGVFDGARFLKCDITNKHDIELAMRAVQPHAVIHCAGITDVDGCENNERKANAVNAEATEMLARYARDMQAFFCYISTDYVFDGRKEGPYKETDVCNPLNSYGLSKLKGEEAVKNSGVSYLIIRTSGLFGGTIQNKNFANSILKSMKNNTPLHVVNDQKGRPTYTKDFARALHCLIEYYQSTKHVSEIFHVTNQDATTWFEFAQAIIAKLDGDVQKIKPIMSNQLHRVAQRPQNWVLSTEKFEQLLHETMRPWSLALDDYLKEINVPVS
ncbi:MAG: dTDP-4-dehydrorhamnose reductase [Candidatus Omnitrophica bacterium]|nr:dTDP-4-dehydrorhamnose reductase [Candidatus Omnitrophota bacterium]